MKSSLTLAFLLVMSTTVCIAVETGPSSDINFTQIIGDHAGVWPAGYLTGSEGESLLGVKLNRPVSTMAVYPAQAYGKLLSLKIKDLPSALQEKLAAENNIATPQQMELFKNEMVVAHWFGGPITYDQGPDKVWWIKGLATFDGENAFAVKLPLNGKTKIKSPTNQTIIKLRH